MKFLIAACLAGSLFLVGCASTTPPVSSDQLRPGPAGNPTRAASSQAALSPITQGEIGTSNAVVPLAPPADMWERIRRGFKMPNLEGDLVRDREQWYASRPDYIERMTGRSNKYLFHIVEELERRDMPTELALLPFVESAFNPQAVSSARAAGMWQFMPATGSDYQLKRNIFRDDRRDVLASTRAALDYLQKLYGMFGDWQLALAAYNWGEGSVSRAIAKNQRLGLPTGYTDLSMPAETRQYVPKLQAIKNIVANPQQFSAELPPIGNHPYFQSVTLTRDLDVELAARLADVRLEDFRALNPAAHKPVLLAAGTPQILLPWDNAAVFKRNFEAYRDGQYASWTAWTVPGTMTVAEAAERAGMSPYDLRTVNNVPPRMLIKGGSTLIIPRTPQVQDDVDAAVADSGQLSFQPEIVTRRTTVRARRNESVASIASRYRVAPNNVAQWNDVPPTYAFRSGYQVVVYLPVQAAREADAARASEAAAARREAAASGHAAHGRAAAAVHPHDAGRVRATLPQQLSSSLRAPAAVRAAAAALVQRPAAGKPVIVQQKRGGTPARKPH